MLQILEDVERVGAVSELEKDLLLTELREAYTEVKFGTIVNDKPVAEVANAAAEQSETELESEEPELEVEIIFDEGNEAEVETPTETPTEEVAEEPTEEEESAAPVIAPIAAAVAAGAVVSEAAAEGVADTAMPMAEGAVEAVADTAVGVAAETATATPIVGAVAEGVVGAVAAPIVESVASTIVGTVTGSSAEPTAEPVAEEQKPAEEDDLSIVNSQLSVNKPHRNAILSLYDETPSVIGEQFPETTSVADMIASSAQSAPSVAPISSLRGAIGVVDKFMLVQELFGGSDDAYEQAINALDGQSSFDDCLIYISEHYAWSPSSEGTKFMMELLQRKYNA